MTHRTKALGCTLAGLLILLISDHAFSQAVMEVGKFSAARAGDKLPPDWKPLVFKKIEKHTDYILVKDGDKVIIKAVAKASASGLTREIKINPKEYPIVYGYYDYPYYYGDYGYYGDGGRFHHGHGERHEFHGEPFKGEEHAPKPGSVPQPGGAPRSGGVPQRGSEPHGGGGSATGHGGGGESGAVRDMNDKALPS
jgi:hypothetical protein